ncbi:MAG: acyl carrier protein [Candidatus Neomarinimicrobiota bacterium]
MSNFEKVQEIVAEKLGIEKSKITMEASFIDDLGADSLDTVELIMKMEEDFSLEIPDEDAERLKTVGEVVNYLDSKLK